MDSKSTIWIVVALLAVLVLSSSSSAKRPPATRSSAPTPLSGPSPMGTTWAQQGPHAPTSNQTNGWDAADHAIDAVGKGFVAAVNAWGGSSDSGGGDDTVEVIDTSYADSLPYDA